MTELKSYIRLDNVIRDKIVQWEADRTNNALKTEIETYFAHKSFYYDFADGKIHHK